jgi:outer membrane immunogenic protein
MPFVCTFLRGGMHRRAFLLAKAKDQAQSGLGISFRGAQAMRRAFISSVAASALLAVGAVATPASAADMFVDHRAVAFDWTGFYVGLQAGGGWARSRITDGIVTVNQSPSGGFVGGYAAGLMQYDWAVVGIEGEINHGWIRRTDQVGVAGNFVGQRVNWFGSVNAVLGVPMDRVLVYATGGVAFASLGHSQTMGAASFSQTRSAGGWTAGTGVDFAVTDDIVIGARYRYYGFGRVTYTPPAGFTSPRTQRTHLHTFGVRAAVKF